MPVSAEGSIAIGAMRVVSGNPHLRFFAHLI
jgi:hypothetical protein